MDCVQPIKIWCKSHKKSHIPFLGELIKDKLYVHYEKILNLIVKERDRDKD